MFDHPRQDCPCQPIDGRHVEVQRRLPVRLGAFQYRADRNAPGAVEQHVDPLEAVDQALDVITLANISNLGRDCRLFVRERFQSRAIDVDGNDRGALLRKDTGGFPADPGCRARDEADSSIETRQTVSSCNGMILRRKLARGRLNNISTGDRIPDQSQAGH